MNARSGRWIATAILAVASSLLAFGTAVADTDITPPEPFDMVADAGDFQTGFHVASPWNSVSASWHLTTDDTSAVEYEMSVDGIAQRVVEEHDAINTLSKRVDVLEGEHTIEVTAIDDSGNRRPANQILTVVVDKYTPTFTSFPLLTMRTGPVSMSSIPMRYTWTAEDMGTGLARIRVGYGPSCCFDVPVDATQALFRVPAFEDRNWRVVLYDGVGRMERVNRQVFVRPLAGGELRRSGDWRNKQLGGAIDNDERVSTEKGERLTFDVVGRSVAWVAAKGPNRGIAEVYVDGRLQATVDLKAAQIRPALSVWTYKLPLKGDHRVAIVNTSPGQRSTISVDTILVQD